MATKTGKGGSTAKASGGAAKGQPTARPAMTQDRIDRFVMRPEDVTITHPPGSKGSTAKPAATSRGGSTKSSKR